MFYVRAKCAALFANGVPSLAVLLQILAPAKGAGEKVSFSHEASARDCELRDRLGKAKRTTKQGQ